MSGRDNTYPNSKVGIEQGAERLFVDSDGYMNFYDNDVTGEQLRNIIAVKTNTVIMINSAGVLSAQTGGESPPILPSLTHLIVFSMDATATTASAQLPSAYKGQELILMTRGAASVASIEIQCGGHASGYTTASVHGYVSGTLSNFTMTHDSLVPAVVRLIGTSDSEWAIVSEEGTVVQYDE